MMLTAAARHISIKRRTEQLKVMTNKKARVSVAHSSNATIIADSGSSNDELIHDNTPINEEITDSESSNDELIHDNVYRSDLSSDSSLTDKYIFNKVRNTALNEALRTWAINYNINHIQLDSLLLILNKYHKELPLSSKTLLLTKGTNYHRKELKSSRGTSAEFVYFGIGNMLQSVLPQVPDFSFAENKIELVVNIDGLPIYKSSSLQFWPILANLYSADGSKTSPFPIAIYCGDSKPASVNEFLNDFILEANTLNSEGLYFNDNQYFVTIKAIICDTPARSFITCVKGHNSYYGCDRCMEKGEYIGNKIVFVGISSALRTHASFEMQSNPEHHTAITPLLQLNNFNIVHDTPLDYMHMACLGIMKKLLTLWIKIRNNNSISRSNIKVINEKIQLNKTKIPSEFQRRPRSLNEVDRFKATEFRTFILYVGPVVLHGMLSKKTYKNFLYFHAAMRIVTCDYLLHKHGNLAVNFITKFIHGMHKIYGAQAMTYNAHCILHLITDAVTSQVSVDRISSFVFESYLGKLKKMVRTPSKPLAQVCKRISENCGLKISVFSSHSETGATYKCNKLNSITYKNWLLKSNTTNDSYIWLKSNKVMEVINMHQENDKLMIEGYIFQTYADLYELQSGFTSRDLKISIVANKSTFIFKLTQEEILAKAIFTKIQGIVFFIKVAMDSWDVIIWKVEDTTDVVPSSWATGTDKNKYLYPVGLKSSKVDRLKRQCVPPSDRYTYDELEVIFKRTVHSYELGERYLRKLEDTSNIESEQEPVPSTSHLVVATDQTDKQFDQILKTLATLEVHVLEIKDQLTFLHKKVNKLEKERLIPVEQWTLPLPLKDIDALQGAEDLLPDKQESLVRLLSLVGGNSLRHYTSLILKRLLSMDLVLEYSARGRKGKKSFIQTKLYAAVVDAIRIRDESTSDTQISQLVGFGLAAAGDWEGCKRNKKTNQPQPE